MPSVSRTSFMGDDAEAVSRLVAACQRPDFSDVPVVERTLQPYFSDPEEEQKAVQEVQRKLTCNSRKNTRSGSPITSAPQPIKGSRPHKVAKASMSSGALVIGSPPQGVKIMPVMSLPASPTPVKMVSSAPVSCAVSPTSTKAPSTTVRAVGYVAAKSPLTSAAGVVAPAACPAIFKSPKPSDLPMPSSALLRRLATVTGPTAFACMMHSVAMPVMAAA